MSLLDYFVDDMNKLVTFKRYDSTLDAGGSPDLSGDNYDAISGMSNIPCFFEEMSTTQKVTRDKKISDKLFFLTCQKLDVRESDHAEIDSVQYNIIGFKNPGSKSDHMELEVEQIV